MIESFLMQDDNLLQDGALLTRRVWLGATLGAGLLGTAILGARWFIRPATKARVPESISPWFFSTRAFQSSRGQMIYHESGSGPGPTLLFVHDLDVGGSSYEWSKVYTAFADRHRVLAVDLIGFGESDRTQRRLSGNDYVASLAEFVESVGGGEESGRRPLIIIGSGMGAGFAVVAAARLPGFVSKLILWMPAGKAVAPWYLNLATRLPTLDCFVYRNLLARRSAIRRRLGLRSQRSSSQQEISHETIEIAALCAQQYQAEFAVYSWLQGRLNVDLPGALREIKVPVTLLYPEHASAEVELAGSKLAAAHTRVTLRKLAGAGPLALLESPGEVAGALKEDLRGESVADGESI